MCALRDKGQFRGRADAAGDAGMIAALPSLRPAVIFFRAVFRCPLQKGSIVLYLPPIPFQGSIPALRLAISSYFLSGASARIIIFWASMEPSACTVITSWKADSWEQVWCMVLWIIFMRSMVLYSAAPPS